LTTPGTEIEVCAQGERPASKAQASAVLRVRNFQLATYLNVEKKRDRFPGGPVFVNPRIISSKQLFHELRLSAATEAQGREGAQSRSVRYRT